MKNHLLPYLEKSADLNYKTAQQNCTSNHIDGCGCKWYHGAWQYLRLLNMVSSPSWHHKFYIKNLCKGYRADIDVLISGLADYSMYAYVQKSAKKNKCHCNITSMDLCKTPLLSTKWYADNTNEKVTTLQTDIKNMTGEYDLICADAFLTRFKKDEMPKVLEKWHSLLKDGGKFVTTIRLHDIKPQNQKRDQAKIDKFTKRAVLLAKKNKNITLSSEEIENMARTYAENMKSNRLGTSEEIVGEIVNQGFEIVRLEEVSNKGELERSRYLRVVAKKKIVKNSKKSKK